MFLSRIEIGHVGWYDWHCSKENEIRRVALSEIWRLDSAALFYFTLAISSCNLVRWYCLFTIDIPTRVYSMDKSLQRETYRSFAVQPLNR